MAHDSVTEPDPTPLTEGAAPTTTAGGVSDASVRVDVDLLDSLMRQVGELVLARNQLNRLADGTADARVSAGETSHGTADSPLLVAC